MARLYSAAWGLLGVGVVYGLCRELTGRTVVAATAAGVYAVLPVVVNAAHEAKPHLAGTVLTLAAVWAAARHARTGRGWAWAGGLAGAASGMVLTGVAAWVVLPVMAWRRPRVLVLASLVAAATFVATNPYLPFDAVFHRDRLASNVGNYGSFYGPSLSPATVANAARLVWLGASPGPVVVAVLGCILWLVHRRNLHAGAGGPGRAARLLVSPVAFVAVQFVLLARGKPAEYARFGLTLDVALAVLAATAVARLPLRPREAALAGLLLVAATALYALPYDLNCLADRRATSTRLTAARALAGQATPGRPLVVSADPAPYGLPPVDLFTWRLMLLPPGSATPAGSLRVRSTDHVTHGLASPISWADKPFEIVPAGGRR